MKKIEERIANLSVFGQTMLVFLVTAFVALIIAVLIVTFSSGATTSLLFMVMGWFAGGVIVGFYIYRKEHK